MGEHTQPTVLIVGAGPTGLMAACQLARFGIPFRIIEQHTGPTAQSRALVIQARSLEIFAQMGIAKRAVAEGKVASALNYVVNGTLAQRVPLGAFGQGLSAFPYLLMLEQSKTEPLLIDDLTAHGGQVEWETELTAITQDPHGVSATIKRPDGTDETMRADWLIGADGAKSIVRHLLAIPFGGETYKESLFVLDCTVSWPFRDDEATIALSDTAFGLFFPMTNGRCRVAGIVSAEYAERDDITYEAATKDYAKNLKMDITLSDPQWISLYHAHHRYVSTFRKRRCFLAGDAAHVHSPAGAQGMNTGLQDSYNLAWKLALVCRGQASEALLDTYNEERLPIARRIVHTTDRLFGITVNTNPLVRFARAQIMPRAVALVPRIKPVSHIVFRTISQIGFTYRGQRLARDASRGTFPRRAPQSGDRLPFATYEDVGGRTINLQERVGGTSFHLFLFPGTGDDDTMRAVRAVAADFPDTVIVETISLATQTRQVYRRLGIHGSGYYLIRPDLHIAYRSADADAPSLRAYLTRWLA